MEMVLIAAIMGQRFTFDAPCAQACGEAVELEATITRRPKNGVRLVANRR